jgi:hypothetical protein
MSCRGKAPRIGTMVERVREKEKKERRRDGGRKVRKKNGWKVGKREGRKEKKEGVMERRL